MKHPFNGPSKDDNVGVPAGRTPLRRYRRLRSVLPAGKLCEKIFNFGINNIPSIHTFWDTTMLQLTY